MAGGFADLDAVASRPAWAVRLPNWDGERVRGTLLVWMGGDPIELITFAPALALARSLVGELVLVVPKPFVRLASALTGVDRVAADHELSDWTDKAAVAAPLSGLPHRLGLTAGSFRSKHPLVVAEPALVDRWKGRLDLGHGKPTVGLVWGDGLGLADLAPLTGITDLRFIALERLPSTMLARSPSASGWEVVGSPVRIEHPGPDFAAGVDARVDCVALLSQLDAVIAIDGQPLRLAGALQRPGVVLLAAAADWVWRMEGERTPVFPSLSLLRRQPEATLATLLPEAVRRVRDIVRS